jgi:3-oxoacyl-[acyl-carrier protein] reductase
MDLGIAGKVAFVSGGSMGMGRATAELFSREGCKVAIAALPDHKDSIDETVEALRASGAQAVGVPADLTVKQDVDRAIATCADAFGVPDIVVANVNGPGPGYFNDVSDDDFVKSFQHMAMSMVYLVRATLPHMREQHWGRIVTLNSAAAKEPVTEIPHILANTARPSAVTLNKSLADEFGRDGITINTIATGYIGTPRMRSYWERMAAERGTTVESEVEKLTASIPLRRVGTPEEMAGVVVFLCSQLGGFVTGEFIHVDGGQHRSAW